MLLVGINLGRTVIYAHDSMIKADINIQTGLFLHMKSRPFQLIRSARPYTLHLRPLGRFIRIVNYVLTDVKIKSVKLAPVALALALII